jgi:plastocyanin
MKKYFLFGAIALLISGFAHGASVTIINSGFTFSPANISINAGDTVNFELAGIHNAVEVSESTWNSNGSTPLPGFSTPFGGGQITGLTAGVHYYVCAPHASLGMKGKIIVNSIAGINDMTDGGAKIKIYPNPTSGKFTLQISEPFDPPSGLEIFNILGEKVYDFQGLNSQNSNEIDLTSVPDGIYFIRINDRKKIYTAELIKQ